MKTKIIMSIALATTVLVACNNEETPIMPRSLTITSGVEVQDRSATQATQIVTGEVVSLWVDDATAKTALYNANQLTADGSGAFTGGVGMFFPQTGNNVDIYGVHGNFVTAFSANDEFPTAGVEFSVKPDQKLTANYAVSDLLYASKLNHNKTEEKANLNFYHMLSKLEVAVVLGTGAPELATTDAIKLETVTLNGKFTPGKTTDLTVKANRAAMITSAGTPTSGNIILPQAISTNFTDGKNYNEAVFVPQSLSGSRITFTLKTGGVMTYDFGNITAESGKKYVYHITLSIKGIEVTSVIVDWDSETAIEKDVVL